MQSKSLFGRNHFSGQLFFTVLSSAAVVFGLCLFGRNFYSECSAIQHVRDEPEEGDQSSVAQVDSISTHDFDVSKRGPENNINSTAATGKPTNCTTNTRQQQTFLSAVQLYFHSVPTTTKGGKCWLIRQSIVNAVDLAFRLSLDPSLTNGSNLVDCNKHLYDTNYWKYVTSGIYNTGFATFNFGAGNSNPGSYVILANFTASVACNAGDYPKIVVAVHGVRFDVAHWQDLLTCLKVPHEKLVSKKQFAKFPNGTSAHTGFLDAAASCYDGIIEKVNIALAGKSVSDVQIIVTGHSLGGAIASIVSVNLLNDYFMQPIVERTKSKDYDAIRAANKRNNVVLLTMGQPRVWAAPGLFRLNVWAMGEDIVNWWKNRDAEGLMLQHNVYRIVTSWGTNKVNDELPLDPVAQIPPANWMGYRHTSLEKRVFQTVANKSVFAHDMLKYYQPLMMADDSAVITTRK